jgi:hypothetical protein
MPWENSEKPPNAKTQRLADDLLEAILPLLDGKRRSDVAMAMMYVCMRILYHYGEDKEDRRDVFLGASDYFKALAEQESDA